MSAAPIVFSADALAASASCDAQGNGPCRIFVKAVSGTLTSCVVKVGPDLAHLSDFDTTTFNSQGAGVTRQVFIDRPVNVIVLVPVGASIDARVVRALLP